MFPIGGKALFLKELEDALARKEIDIAIHSMKDVPGVLPKKFSIAAVLKREDPRDCFVSLKFKSIDELPIGSVVGTSSVRRKLVLESIRPDLNIIQFRGNVGTRLQKIKNSDVDASILACCGLNRLNLFDKSICHPISTEKMFFMLSKK